PALKAFFKSIEETGKVAIHFKYNNINRLEQSVEFNIYRVIGELTSNSLKHGNPKNIYVILEKSEDKLIVEYTDDGKGFNVELEMSKNKGMGLHNIIQRIRSNDGIVDFKSTSGTGMQAKIEVPLKK
ncbi:MAG: sensor histidine kinase, partial [Bacteroidota bacterium]